MKVYIFIDRKYEQFTMYPSKDWEFCKDYLHFTLLNQEERKYIKNLVKSNLTYLYDKDPNILICELELND